MEKEYKFLRVNVPKGATSCSIQIEWEGADVPFDESYEWFDEKALENIPPEDWEPSCSARFYCERCEPVTQKYCRYKKAETLK